MFKKLRQTARIEEILGTASITLIIILFSLAFVFVRLLIGKLPVNLLPSKGGATEIPTAQIEEAKKALER